MSKEYGEVMDDMYTRAEICGANVPDTAWLDIDGIDWPNPHYHGEPVNHPLDDTGTQTNPPLSNSALDKYRNGDKS